jgi:hypothetical protein
VVAVVVTGSTAVVAAGLGSKAAVAPGGNPATLRLMAAVRFARTIRMV